MPSFDCKRNAHPAYGQTQAATSPAAPARDAVCGLNAMLEAEKRTHRNVGYKNSVARFHMLTMSRCNELCNELIAGTYQPQRGEVFEVFEPKHRVTVSSKYRDRVPQSSFIVNYFYPHVVPHLIENNFACLKGRGVDAARDALKKMLEDADEDDWCLKADFKGYFASIRHDRLYAEMREYITDPWAAAFFRQTVENTGRSVGLDLGSEVYQLSATSFPNRMDHRLNDGAYSRYQDDLLYVGTKEQCRAALAVIREETERLGLTLHPKKTFVQPISRPIKYLGFSFLRHPNGRVTMKRLPDKLRHERRKLRRMKDKGVPMELVEVHYQSVRAILKKGTRSDLMRMDEFYNKLFEQGGKRPC